jgi:hypothetical protein
MQTFMNRRQLWIRRLEKISGVAPLDFKMARYIEKLQITSVEYLREALIRNQHVPYVGVSAMNKLRARAGLPLVSRKHSWKDEAKRLYALLDKHNIKYDKRK